MDKRPVNFIIFGGSGHWSEINHYPSLMALKNSGLEFSVKGICDPINPYEVDPSHFKVGRRYLTEILAKDKPRWINPNRYTLHLLKDVLRLFLREHDIKFAIIATNPSFHYYYADLMVDSGVNVLCDKPIIVEPNSSSDIRRARLIEKKFTLLLQKVRKIKRKNARYQFCTPLRRRALTPFLEMARGIEEVYFKSGQGLTYMTVIINGGLHRYPIEFEKGGAHGYLDGVGALSHSSYHYIDVIAWYLQLAKGNAKYIELRVPYISRIRDYLSRKSYAPLMKINGESSRKVANMTYFNSRVLNAELDFTIHMHLKNRHDRTVGLLSFTSNHATFTPRQAKYRSDVLDYANEKNGGRMSQVYFDVHQGAMQNWQLVKNDVVFEENKIRLVRRLHPSLGEAYTEEYYRDAYDSQTITPKDLFSSFVKKSIGVKIESEHDKHLQLLETQALTHRIFSASYELIALSSLASHKNHCVRISLS